MLSNAAYSFVPLGPQGQEQLEAAYIKYCLLLILFLVTKGTAPER